jgi:hypothetical protein
MSYPVVVVPFLKVSGMALYPFILVKNRQDINDPILIRHETIHLKQAAEMLVIPFYLAYIVHYLYNLYLYGNHDQAYYQIIFEREAYRNEMDASYLQKRQFWAWRFY